MSYSQWESVDRTTLVLTTSQHTPSSQKANSASQTEERRNNRDKVYHSLGLYWKLSLCGARPGISLEQELVYHASCGDIFQEGWCTSSHLTVHHFWWSAVWHENSWVSTQPSSSTIPFWTYQHHKMRLLGHLNAMTTSLAALMGSDGRHWFGWWVRKEKTSHGITYLITEQGKNKTQYYFERTSV